MTVLTKVFIFYLRRKYNLHYNVDLCLIFFSRNIIFSLSISMSHLKVSVAVATAAFFMIKSIMLLFKQTSPTFYIFSFNVAHFQTFP